MHARAMKYHTTILQLHRATIPSFYGQFLQTRSAVIKCNPPQSCHLPSLPAVSLVGHGGPPLNIFIHTYMHLHTLYTSCQYWQALLLCLEHPPLLDSQATLGHLRPPSAESSSDGGQKLFTTPTSASPHPDYHLRLHHHQNCKKVRVCLEV